MSTVEVKVPDIGDFKEVEIIELLVKVGDTIKVDQSLITVESDKASMEIPSSHAGVVKEIKVKLGDKVAEGSLLLTVEAAAADAAPAAEAAPAPAAAPAPVEAPKEAPKAEPAKAAEPAPVAQEAAPAPVAAPAPAAAPAPVAAAASAPATASNAKAHASPSIRKFARELGVDLGTVAGSGPKGRITQEDVQNYVKGIIAAGPVSAPVAAAPMSSRGGAGLDLLPWPSLDFSKFGTTSLLPLSRIKKISGPNLHRNWVMIPHVTQYDEADVTELEELRKSTNTALAKSGVKLTMLAFVIKACVAALKKYPEFNSSLDAAGENLILKQYYNIGFAADTPQGLVVPVVKGVDQKTVTQIAQEMGELSAQAREGKLKPADMQGATFTISSLGGIGGTYFTPLINAPEVAIIGLSKTSMKPVWDGKQFVPRLIMPLSLSYDHRVIDGAQGARFVTYLSEMLADLRKSLL
ncbi:dihydrolipoyllysine-residue acetyltransferase [Herminiimonas aquatilis]|uniref:Dihydrolipoamide acetyltransferase component of pyruvate dehydrogenase complex n=1 Tax=Herminiimonas aquatilis TaxID=345342 RepID=A0ABW2J5W8_9BURK